MSKLLITVKIESSVEGIYAEVDFIIDKDEWDGMTADEKESYCGDAVMGQSAWEYHAEEES